MDTLSADSIDRAASLILAARRASRVLDGLPRELQPRSLEDAYAIQDRLLALSGEPIGGWFLGCTNTEIQRQLSLAGPYSGRLLASALRPSPALLFIPRRLQPVLEVEFAFRLGRDLPPRAQKYGADEVAEAVESVHPAIEVVTSRLKEWTRQPVLDLIADNGTDGVLVYGEAVTDWRQLDLAGLVVELRVAGRVVRTGTGANALGNPLTALVWLANHRSRAGDGLRAGHIHNTGSVTSMFFPKSGDHAVADFGPLGSAELRLA